MSSVGQCKTDPPTGVAGAAYTAITGDADAGFATGVTTGGSTLRKVLGAMIQAFCSALIGTAPTGTAKILAGQQSVVISDPSITTASVIPAHCTGVADATCLRIERVVLGSGTATLYGNANATANTNVSYAILN